MNDTAEPTVNPKWQALPARSQRILGVLIEKAKTTPDQYPLSLASLVAGCNQKSNRFPLMELEPDDLEEPLERLKQVGAAVEVQGSSRVARFKHMAYEWLGVDKVELAIMAELLLRGAQTEGELRGRASRMEPIADLAALRPLLDSLKAKNLVVSVTPAGRGHVITHNLYEERELEKIRREYAGRAEQGSDDQPTPQPTPARSAAIAPSPTSATTPNWADEVASLREEVAELKSQLADLRDEFQKLLQ
jgi:uncharacterized protein YceH (UPF0502 family)